MGINPNLRLFLRILGIVAVAAFLIWALAQWAGAGAEAQQPPCIPPACSSPTPTGPSDGNGTHPPPNDTTPNWVWHASWAGTILLGVLAGLKLILPSESFKRLFSFQWLGRPRSRRPKRP